METTNGEPIEVPDETLSSASHLDLVAGSSHQCGQDCGEQRIGAPAPNIGAERADPSRQELSISQMGCPQSEVDDRQEATSELSEDVPTLDRAAGNGTGPRPGGPLPCSESGVGQGPQSSPVEIANQPSEQQSLRASTSTLPQCSLDGSGSNTQTPLLGTVNDGNQSPGHDAQAEGQGQRQTSSQALSQEGVLRATYTPELAATLLKCLRPHHAK